jgi:kinesin family protein 15
MEVGDAKIVAVQKMAEASCIYAKFEEAQDTMKEADIMINELMIANEAMKLDMERMKQIEVKLTSERDMLDNEVQSLQSLNGLKDQQFEDLEMQFGSDLMETRDLVVQLEGVISQVQISFENFLSMLCEFHSLKALVLDSGKLVRSWLEDVWSEIIVKDSAVSVLHLCHMGILLETVTGLNAENGLLQHGLSESDSLITDLRERNSKTSRELQTCRTLKGKLLVDIKNSFVRILRKEEETERFGLKLTSFEKKISDIQLQEELMLQRSNYMGSQLAVLMKELDSTNTNAVESLFNQEKMLEDEKELRNSQTELFMMDLCSKDIESFILASQLEEMCLREVAAEREHLNCCSILENLKNEVIFSKIDTELKEHLLVAKEADVALLQRKVKEANREVQDLLSSLKDVACSNDKLRSELGEVMTTRMRLLSQIQELEAECDKLQKNLKSKESDLEKSSSHIDVISQQKQDLQKSICQLETASSKLQTELELKDSELRRLNWLEEENKSLKDEVSNLKTEKSLVLQDLEKKKYEVESSLSQVDMENDRLQDKILSLESVIASLQTDLEMKSAEVSELQNSQSVAKADMCLKNQDLQTFVCKLNALKDENILLRSEIRSHKKVLHEVLTKSALNTAKYVASVESVHSISHKLFNGMEKECYMLAEKMFHEICENIEGMSGFLKEIECLESCTADLVSDNMSLQAELLRKDDILKGLSFDMSLLQESASNTKDQKDKLKEVMASMEALEDELVVKSSELEQTVAHSQLLEAQLMEKIDAVSNLESDIAKGHLSLESLSCENLDLRAQIQEALAAKCSLEEELTEKRSLTESLETELSQMGDALGEMSDTIESLRSHLSELTSERDQLQLKMHSLEDKLQRTEAWAEEIEAIAEEAQQVH